ncbi:MAG TPA: response regulator transcription factor [Jatrophihabitans sp.]|jgi:DNA-binding response OmpR family regulator
MPVSERSALIVDDDDDIRELLSVVLSRAGFAAAVVDGGLDALVAAHDAPPAVYVLDVRMPDMNGHDVCRALKADERTSAPVLMVSAEASDLDVAAAFASGCDDFLAKPFTPRELIGRLEELLSRTAAGSAA